MREKARAARERGVTEVCTVSGLHPEFDAQSYADIYSWIRDEAPGVHIHASNPMEVAYAARKSGISTGGEVLEMMRDAGLATLCGTAAEILVDSIRAVICPDKIDTATWTRIIKEAHRLGIRSTATIMYGSCESAGDRARHLAILREIQDETRGFTEFVPLSFIHKNTPPSTGRGASLARGGDRQRRPPARCGCPALPRQLRPHPGLLGEGRDEDGAARASCGRRRPRRDAL